MKNLSAKLLAAMACLTMLACSDDNTDDETSSSTTSQVSGLPKATDAVSSSSSSGFSEKVGSLAATTGLALASWEDATKWTATESRAMCETGLGVKDALSEAMSPDKILCYVGSIIGANKVSGTLVETNYNYMRLTNFPENSMSMTPLIKMKIVRTAGAITTFEMFSCFGGTDVSPVQTEYFIQSISDGTSSLSSIYAGSEGGNSYGSRASVSGTVDASYAWLSKTMNISRFWNGGSGGNFGQKVTITQNAGNFLVDGYSTGSWGTNIFTNRYYTSIQLLNASTPKAIALGDGSSKYEVDWCNDSNSNSSCADETGGNRFTSGQVYASWLGDTRQNLGTASDGDYYTDVSSATLRTNDGIPTVAFTSGETWDCTLPSGSSWVDADLADMMTTGTTLGNAFAACDNKYQFANNSSDGYVCNNPQ